MAKIVYRKHCPDVRLWRAPAPPAAEGSARKGIARCNLRRSVVHHSPDGPEWGYSGSGPADLALAILALCLPVGCDGEEGQQCFQGHCSPVAWRLHQGLKRSVISQVQTKGGTIAGVLIDAWIDGALGELAEEGYFAGEQAPTYPRYAPRS